jgi:hypothetical protein
MKVVKYEEQLRAVGTQHWGKWFEIDEEQYNRNKANPIRFDWEYRVRRLFVDPSEDYQ